MITLFANLGSLSLLWSSLRPAEDLAAKRWMSCLVVLGGGREVGSVNMILCNTHIIYV